MDLNTFFFMRPSLHGMVYPPIGPREYLLLRGKLPVSPPPLPLLPQRPPQHSPSTPPQDLSPRKRPASPPSSIPHPHPHQDQYGPIKRLAEVQPPRNPNKPLTSFSIADILESPKRPAPRVVRPWGEDDDEEDLDSRCSGGDTSGEEGDNEEIDVDDETPPKSKKGVSPLDALFKMTSKTFDGQHPHGSQDPDGAGRDHLSLFTKSQPPKKRRKSRTAFTNQQIYELEKRFLYQKYLTPADKEEIAQTLGLSNAQVITWFQNRRAKLKRDLEELKADVTAAKIVSSGGEEDSSQPPSFTSLEELQLYNKNALKKVAACQQAAAGGEDASRDSLESTEHPHDHPAPKPVQLDPVQ